MSKHAFLLIVHKNPAQVGKLLEALDDDRNLIVVHCDKKMAHDDVEAISNAPLESAELKVLQVNDVLWGSYTQVETELLLLREALGCGCSYYHLLSGEDLPLRSQDELHAFFDESGKEFVACNPQFEWPAVLDARVRQRHLQNRNASFSQNLPIGCWWLFNALLEWICLIVKFVMVMGQTGSALLTGLQMMWSAVRNGSDRISPMLCAQTRFSCNHFH